MVKIDIISGFLGAGKTTLIKKLLESDAYKSEKVVLVENEFGEIGIDGSFLKDAGIEIKEINAGCICCSLVGDFEASIKELVDRFNPTRIIIEPSGVGKLSDIVGAVQKVDADLELNILTTVVDGGKVKMYLKNFGEFFNNQVENAHAIVVGKVDKINEAKLQESVELIRQVNKDANIITTNITELDPNELVKFLEKKDSLKDELIKKMIEEHEASEDEEECDDPNCSCHHHHHHHDDDEDEECECHHHDHEDHECCHEHHHDEEGHEHHHHHHHHGHDADEVFTSWGLETVKAYTKDELKALLETLCKDESLGIILRSKGILKASDNDSWYYFDLVAGDYEIRLGSPDYTGRFVVIGSKLDLDKIQKLFK